MIGLDEAKTMIHGADPDLDSEHYCEIEASAVFEKGWVPLGDDYFYNERRKLVAAPSGGSPIRILVYLGAIECSSERMDTLWPYDICSGMGKEAWRQGIIGF